MPAVCLPCVVHNWERVKWVGGPEAVIVDMTKQGELSQAIDRLSDKGLRHNISERTREWAETLSKKNVIGRYIRMYKDIIKVKKK